jgi:hypothetical protein
MGKAQFYRAGFVDQGLRLSCRQETSSKEIVMPNTLRTLGTLAGVVGLLTCLFAGLARLTGIHWLMGFEIVTLLQIGIGGMVLGCFCLLLVLTAPSGRP